VFLAEMYCTAGDFERALECSDEAERITAALGETWCRSWAMSIRALAWCGQNDYERAAESARTALELKVALEDRAGLLFAAEVLSWTMAAAGQWTEAARLHAAVQPRGDRRASPLEDFGFLSEHRTAWSKKINEKLGPDGCASAERAGAAMGLEEIGQFALSPVLETPDSGPSAARNVARAPLTRRETEVAGLLAEGLTNREIAGRLVISPRTAEVHVERILVKLGFHSRAQVGAWWDTAP
jgi:non-specific serine/threonine protein kinase